MQSHSSAEKTLVKPEKILVFEFSDSEKLFQKIENLYKNRRMKSVKSDLFKINDTYILVLHTKSAEISPSGIFCGKTKYFYILEHGKMLCEKNAVFRIGRLLTKDF